MTAMVDEKSVIHPTALDGGNGHLAQYLWERAGA